MAITHVYTMNWTGSGNAAKKFTVSAAADGEDNREVLVPAATTDLQVDLDFAFARLKAVFINVSGVANGTVITIKTNSVATPGNTVAITAPGGVAFVAGYMGTNPFTVDVTAVFLTNPSTTDAALVAICPLYDSTP